MNAFTPRNVVKFVVHSVVHLKATSLAKSALTDYTQLEEDDLTVKITSQLVGWGVSDLTKPYTDKMVDKTADFIVAQRAKRRAKKESAE